MFSDESRFSLQSDSRRTFIWRAPGTRYHQENIIERHRYGGAGVLVWGGIILGSRTDLHVQIGTMTSQIYRDVILEQHVRLFRGAMGAQFVFMDDNARPHRANIISECLQSEDITKHSPTATRRSFQNRFNVPVGPEAKTIRMLFAKFEWTGSVPDDRKGNVGPTQTVVTPENATKVSGIVQQNPRKRIQRIASETGLKYTSTQKILKNSLRLFPYKIQSHQVIPMKAVQQRVESDSSNDRQRQI
ncbi:Transposable element Tcb1 transposase, partial [Stegodyphus mimosarum]